MHKDTMKGMEWEACKSIVSNEFHKNLYKRIHVRLFEVFTGTVIVSI
jgi:hypothetical protein